MYGGGPGGGGFGPGGPGGFQQPQMTGYPMMMQPQQTGFQPQFQQPQQTGFQGGMQPQMTGMGYGGFGGGGMQPQMTGMPNRPPPQQQQQQQQGALQPQQTGFQQRLGVPSMSGMGGGFGGGGRMGPSGGMLGPQQTGFPGGGGGGPLGPQPTGLMPQMTGMPINDPRLRLMSMQFAPAAQPYSGGYATPSNMNFSQQSMQPSNFQDRIQHLSVQQQGTPEPKIPWKIGTEEKRSYDRIFRAWDAKGTGFIGGEVAREVFGQSGIEQDKLMQIWHLADTNNRGKLNLAEFHVAMGLIYRGEWGCSGVGPS